MALQSGVLMPTQGNPTRVSVNASANSATTALPSRLVVITSDSDVFVQFGPSTLSATAATTSSFPIWAKSYLTFDLGKLDGSVGYINIFNNGGSAAVVTMFALGV